MVVVMVGKILGVKMGIFQIENDISVNVIFIRRNIVGCGEHYSFLIPSKKGIKWSIMLCSKLLSV